MKKEWQMWLYWMTSDIRLAITYPYHMFLLWLMIVKGEDFLPTRKESLEYFWDNLSFNKYF